VISTGTVFHFTHVLFSVGTVTYCGGLASIETTLCLFGQSFDAEDLRLRGVKDLYSTCWGNGLVALETGKAGNGTCMKWALGNHSNSAGKGAFRYLS